MVEASVEPISRGSLRCDRSQLFEGHGYATASERDPAHEFVDIPVYNVVVDHPEGTILWDTGSHPRAGDGHWPTQLASEFVPHDADEHGLPEDLRAAGYSIDAIDAVVQSHLHLDHAGGLEHFAGRDVPVFVHEAELQYAYYSANTDEGSGAYVSGDFDHDLDWHVVHQRRESHFADVEFVHLPGHSPGLMGTVIRLDGFGTLVLAGDQAFCARNYRDGVPMSGGLLWSKRDWIESNRRLRDIERRHDAAFVYGHDLGTFDGHSR